MELATLVICFLCLMVMSVPIAYNLILSSLAYMIVSVWVFRLYPVRVP